MRGLIGRHLAQQAAAAGADPAQAELARRVAWYTRLTAAGYSVSPVEIDLDAHRGEAPPRRPR